MKKILFILILTMSSVYAKPCMTDIYFGNGVWNNKKQAVEGRIALRELMLFRAATLIDIQKEGHEYDFKNAYNPSVSTNDDLIETFYQLKESGQVSNNYFQWMFTLLNSDEDTKPYQKLQDIIRTHNDDAIYMFTKYENESFSKKHNVLLVAHSQGNLFGNKMYTLMSEAQKNKFRMVSVATPANSVAGGGPYVTATGDYVIRPIPGSLPSNIAGFGHTFIGTYLNVPNGGVPGDGSENAPKIIALHVKSAYIRLEASECLKYWAVSMTLNSEGYMNIFGSPIVNGNNSGGQLLIGKVDFKTYPSEKLKNPERYVCKGDWLPWGYPDLKETFGNLELYYGSPSDNPISWKAGEIYNKNTVKQRKKIHYTVQSKNKINRIELKHEGELSDIALSAFE